MTHNGRTVPEPVARVADLMSAFRRPWYLCGGWAVDVWLGRVTRDHPDLDIAVFQDDQRAIFDHLAGWQLIAHDPNVAGDTDEPWDDRQLDLPAHIHARSKDRIIWEVLLNERAGNDWVFYDERRVTLPLDQFARQSAWGLPTLVPEVLLFYKATAYFGEELQDRRPHDEADFHALLPNLTGEQRDWLQEAISLAYPEHPWLTQLSS